MKVQVHLLCYNESEILGYMLRHWQTFSDTIIVHDGGSTDGSQDIARLYGATVRPWDTKGQLNDEMAMELKNECWKGTEADWVICVDADELVYFPRGARDTLGTYSRMGAAVIKPHGFDMYSETFPTTDGQIYEEVRMGAPSDKWYAKPILFSPRKVMESGFGIGAHESRPVLKDGRCLSVGPLWPKANPPTYLLHFHHGIGTPERVAKRLDEKRLRLADINVKNRWGNFKPGAVHVQEKLDFIKAGLTQVIGA